MRGHRISPSRMTFPGPYYSGCVSIPIDIPVAPIELPIPGRISRISIALTENAATKEKPRRLSQAGFQMLAEWTGLEPATPGVTGRYSNQLNYHSRYDAVERVDIVREQVSLQANGFI